jgi:hypothetical protein
MSPDRKRRHRIIRGKIQGEGYYADCVTCGHVGGFFVSRDGATAQFEEHRRTGKSLRNGEWS